MKYNQVNATVRKRDVERLFKEVQADGFFIIKNTKQYFFTSKNKFPTSKPRSNPRRFIFLCQEWLEFYKVSNA